VRQRGNSTLPERGGFRNLLADVPNIQGGYQMKKVVCAIAMLALILTAGSVFAQGPFTDVPTDHWAYAAVDQLVKDGVIVGYPDGTFGGKRAMTRFEFAQALARAIPVIVDQAVAKMPVATPAGVSAADLKAVADRVSALEAKKPEVTKADLDAIQKMANEFKEELTAMGVDLDALKRDVSALDKRLTAVEKEIERVKITGTATIWAMGDRTTDGVVVDRDNRTLNADDRLLERITFVRDIDLNIRAKVGEDAFLVASLNAGNYLNYLESVADFTDSTRPSSWRDQGQPTDAEGDVVFPYWLYAQVPFASGQITVGRQPMQWTPYTLKMVDVDSYTDNAKTDNGDFPLDGIKGVWKFDKVGLQLFAAKADQNPFLGVWNGSDVTNLSGLASQVNNGLYRDFFFGPFNAVGGNAIGGLIATDQLAGARVTVGVPKGTLGLSYIEAGGGPVTVAAGPFAGAYQDARVWGADLGIQLGKFMVGADWTTTDTFGNGATADIDNDNTALDANVGFGLGKVDLKLGWKKIESNFTAPGSWDRLGSWVNPTDVQGEYAKAKIGLADRLDLMACAEFLKGIDGGSANLTNDDDVRYYNAGLKWGFTPTTDLNLGYELTKYSVANLSTSDLDEQFITIGLGHQFNAAASMKLTYQIVDFNGDGGVDPDFADYKGNLAVAQFMVKF
jgi:hypothetical protein